LTAYIILTIAIFGALYGVTGIENDIPIIGFLFEFIHTGLDKVIDVGFNMVLSISQIVFEKVGNFINIKWGVMNNGRIKRNKSGI